MDLIKELRLKARNSNKRIVYPEGDDPRILKAVSQVIKEKLAVPILLGNEGKIKKAAKQLKLNISKIEIINPEHSSNLTKYASELFRLRKDKGLAEQEASRLVKQPNYFGTMMLHFNDVDGLISGAVYTTAETLRPALQIIKTRPDTKLASSFFLMVLKEKVYLFADCSVVRNPTPEELSEIAISTAVSAQSFGIKPKIALLSYSTNGSGSGPSVDLVQQAAELARNKRPDLLIEGEMQLDAALVPEVAKRKCPNSKIKGDANVFIFPDLNSGNIGYKLVERLGRARAIGPIVQGLNKPLNVLSRGCDVEDIVDVTAITVFNSMKVNKK